MSRIPIFNSFVELVEGVRKRRRKEGRMKTGRKRGRREEKRKERGEEGERRMMKE